jgi:hypothetical protein
LARSRVSGFASIALMMSELPRTIAMSVSQAFAEFSAIAVTTPPRLIISVVGVAGIPPLQSRLTLVTLADGTDLIILGREAE